MLHTLKAGAGKSTLIFPKNFFPIENYIAVHHDLHVRVLLIESNAKFVIVSLEMTSIQQYEIEALKELISTNINISKEQVWICVTHTFSSPHLRSINALEKDPSLKEKNDMYQKILEDCTLDALHQAIDNLQEASLGVGNGYCSVNVNRDVSTPQGWWIGMNDLGPSDKSVPIVRFDDKYHHPIAILYSYDVQSSIMDGSTLESGYKEVTSDLTGIACQMIEEQYDNCVALYVVGAAADQAPIFKTKHNIIDRFGYIHEKDIQDKGFTFVEALGEKLANQIIIANEKITTRIHDEKLDISSFNITLEGQKIPANMRDIKPTQNYVYEPDIDRSLKVEVVILNHLAIIGVTPELSSVTAETLKKKSPFPMTMVFTLVNGGSKYMSDATSYDRYTYEAMNSMYARGSAEKFINDTVKYLEERMDDK
ncbi:MAG: hypothetical protein LUF02_09140 [Erysipelotrichaceae bacterium]|nr:hypothetical protein [Erysipelotrichaceae bacterium]